ncbi:hypothetical protein FQN55_005995 [Onygenales sp. PD_40]|nr:hypothetical protein FQN55_005995 [Onygenales sp. PD_40]KAK2772838.1 hypothetical protein FQN52_004819 [Onygenales sp. PD_12]KAK2779905.1 hypothetical protein FQN53_001244 [Emmonsiellopsis sp. PD_33]KAK2795386.1 hypothetical protein FQN51_000476 [Onygenales sp. PD_10]
MESSNARLTEPTTPRRSSKRKRTPEQDVVSPRSTRRKQVRTAIASGETPVIDLTRGSTPDEPKTTPRKRTKKTDNSPVAEKEEHRLRVFRSKPPKMFNQKLERAQTQRLFVVDRTRGGTEEVPEETVQIVGTTGNIYQVVIGKEPSCTCPDALKGNQCKHIIYVLFHVLKVSRHLQYQLAFLSSELREIFSKAPLNPKDSASTENEAGNRKAVEGDCPICFMEFHPAAESIVWCKAACGNNIHKACFDRWAASRAGEEVRCVYCRTPWAAETSYSKLLTEGTRNAEGYINVAPQMGLSGIRDYSSYHPQWVRRHLYDDDFFW